METKDPRPSSRLLPFDSAAGGRVSVPPPSSAERARTLWRGLIAGRSTMIDHFDREGARHLIIVENPGLGLGGLSRREREILARACSGAPVKRIALELALGPSTIATHLAQAAHKLGFPNRNALIQASNAIESLSARCIEQLGLIRFPIISAPLETKLSRAEHRILLAVLRGESNEEIARSRCTSPRTVANQIASIYRKLDVSSRHELAALCSLGAER
jgi:DNA-binding CsgD family transcriptional regulator